ncbi:MAG: hypothetical protein WKG01_03530 [Kofleriaceae bacterium]
MLKLLLPFLLLSAACADDPVDDFSPFGDQSLPNPDGKSDEVRSCGEASCVPRLCGYDCTAGDAQCSETCAPTDARAEAFVKATFSGAHTSTFDSRNTPFDPVFALDNVLIYGCDLWDFSDQKYDGLEIELTELVHSSFVVNPKDPTRHDRKFLAYISPFTGPGSYRGEAMFQARHDAPYFYSKDACAIDITKDASGGIHGALDCQITETAGGTGTVRVQAEVGCPINAMDPLFVRRTPAL